jgi:epoxyqueuosine reductase
MSYSQDEIAQKIREEMKRCGWQVRTVSIKRLPEVQEAVGRLVGQGLLDKRLYESWNFYLDSNKSLPKAKTIIVVAMPHPISRVWFKYKGSVHPADIPSHYFFRITESRAKAILNNVLKTAGFKAVKAHLALKTLAVRSGLATYGRNNITYVSGMGSLCSLDAFYTDWLGEEDNWQEVKAMEACEDCSLCRENCPTGSITADRFLIHAEKCLGFLQQTKPDFPYWVRLQPDWHNALMGCMQCQFVCPVDKPYLDKIAEGPSFSEEETGLILNKTPWEVLSQETRQKLKIPAELYPRMVSNLSALIEKQSKQE